MIIINCISGGVAGGCGGGLVSVVYVGAVEMLNQFVRANLIVYPLAPLLAAIKF